MEILQKTELAARIIETACVIYAPKDTGNLSLNAIRCVFEDGVWQVVIGGEIAPYAVYTNEPWLSSKWKGAVNPNQGWIERAIESVRMYIIGIFQDRYTIEEIQKYQNRLSVLATNVVKARMEGVIDFDI